MTIVRVLLLSILVIVGVSRSFLSFAHIKSEWLTASSFSPLLNVFTNKSFFSKISLYYLYDKNKIEIPIEQIINSNSSDIYSGKIKYNVFFMTNILTPGLAEVTARLYFCNKKIKIDILQSQTPPDSIEIELTNRLNGEVIKNVRYSCP
ncbi:MAG: hypothetical protein WA160_05500 [Pseudobdellovibrio sp.]